ncbi:uncharacterized protein LOC113510121 isoform X1 [Galleria mellonella]|uniref:phospholipase A2 n=1 Tax=Galleria mellonella TaxID=7137 RepID=A0A6J1W9H6_GALME|nr:uncharacterized protein LOC113510121 isoform X1 [Galleria mellonella]XP_052754122.1 uncharacterized protein LOC113510121 isoform X1 [Galleria mellonella]XP_052754129.1 uncharacterized protein LOC113510121 isoform X1 [Galleria mellonella]
MEIKSPKAKKKSSFSRLISWGKMYRIPLLMLLLLGSTNCDEGESSEDLATHSIPKPNNSNFKPIDNSLNLERLKLRHRHTHMLPNLNRSLDNSDRQLLSDIKYLRRHLNKEIVNFVMKDNLVDGEMEVRVHFNGITAKETSVGSDGHGLKLRQLTDGRHLVQMIYAPNGDIQDCEHITQGRSARNFLKTLRKELKLALDEETYRILERNPHNFDNENFYRHFYNMTVRILKNGEGLPSDVVEWLDYDRLKTECLQRHEEMTYMMENRNKVSENSLARSRRSIRENFILPGTKWCGAGQLATRYNELGADSTEDRCCRAHDNCRVNIGAFKRRFGYFNYRPFTVSHCRCDRRTKRDATELLRVPGTKWCGKGFSATRYSQLGGYSRTDRCCRIHDLRCPFWIGGMEKKYGVYNWRVNTLMHCRCDERFRACLKLADTSVSNMVGKLFFNIVQTKCFVLKPVKICTKRSWWGKCMRKGYTKQAFLRDNLPY